MKSKVLLALRVKSALVAMALMFCIGLIGCADSKTDSQPDKGDGKSGSPVAKANQPSGKSDHKEEHTLDGFWCADHGLPEEECWKCNQVFCDQCEKKGDWCKEHLRPKSQCFKCDPALIDKWAKVYEAKTGKKAPKPHNY